MYNIIIYNKNNKQKHTIKCVPYANTFKKRLIGLIGKNNFNGLIFKQKYSNRINASIHTCFMKQPIDIIYINHEMQIKEITTLKPWKIYIPKKGYIEYIIELPEKSIIKNKLKIGDKVVMQYAKKKK